MGQKKLRMLLGFWFLDFPAMAAYDGGFGGVSRMYQRCTTAMAVAGKIESKLGHVSSYSVLRFEFKGRYFDETFQNQ